MLITTSSLLWVNMNTTSRNLGFKDGAIIILVIALLINFKIPDTKLQPEPVYIIIDQEHTQQVNVEVEVEKPIYIEVPLFIEVEPKEEKKAQERIIEYKTVEMPANSGFKSYMSYKTITKVNSLQYKLQQWSHTDPQGFRLYEGRYCLALGSGTGAFVGQYVDVILENGTHIPGVVGDMKADGDTDPTNMYTSNGCCCEFIVDMDYLVASVKRSGNCSLAKPEWASPVVNINVLDRKVF